MRPNDFSDKHPSAAKQHVEIESQTTYESNQSREGDKFKEATSSSLPADRLEGYDVFTEISGDGHDFEACTSFSEPADQSDGYDAFAESSGATEARGPWAVVLDIATREPFFTNRHTPCTIGQVCLL